MRFGLECVLGVMRFFFVCFRFGNTFGNDSKDAKKVLKKCYED